ncbi:MAG: hypothetical protein CL917_19250 [Deltaproteobacteria bacterium]|nr:hypothetical protein [Deltaproteobacteria bacterium]
MSGILTALGISLAMLPIWVPGLALLDFVRKSKWSGLRCGVYLTWLLLCEVAGLTWAAFLLIRPHRSQEAWLARHYALQHRWAGALFDGAVKLFGLRLEVEGAEALEGGPILLFMRHATVADALLPAVVASRPYGIRLRYVLKQELRIDPCLDIVGDRLPNAFVQRGLPDGSREVARVASLARDLGSQDGVVIYPEGTRFTAGRRARVLEKIKASGDLERWAAVEALKHVLPPRLGGVMGLIDASPNTDVVFCAHTGLERVTRLGDLFSGHALGARLKVRCWRVAAHDIPKDEHGREAWLENEWARVESFVAENQEMTKAR